MIRFREIVLRSSVIASSLSHLYPNLEWLRTRSVNPRPDHLEYEGLILPIDDPFWQTNQPGNLYNCKCNWRQTNKPATAGPEKVVKPAKGLEGNPYKTREIFTDKHPYFTRPNEEAKTRIDEFVSKQIFEKQFEKTSDGYFVHPLQDKKASDFSDLVGISKYFVEKGKEVFILPKLTVSKGDLYKYMYMGAYAKKQPDLLIGGLFYEFESFVGKYNKDKLGNMLSRAVKQSDRIIIDVRGIENISTNYIHRRIVERVKKGQNIIEIWILKEKWILEKVY